MKTVLISVEGRERYHTLHSALLARDTRDPESPWFVIMTGMAADCYQFMRAKETSDIYEYRVARVDDQ